MSATTKVGSAARSEVIAVGVALVIALFATFSFVTFVAPLISMVPAVVSGWRYRQTRSKIWLALLGVSLAVVLAGLVINLGLTQARIELDDSGYVDRPVPGPQSAGPGR
jgi:hypothetical protein